MNASPQEFAAINYEAIARLAFINWKQEGRLTGRDREYWLRAEQKLRAISQQGHDLNTFGQIEPLAAQPSAVSPKPNRKKTVPGPINLEPVPAYENQARAPKRSSHHGPGTPR